MNTQKMILLRWAEGAVVVVEEEPRAEGEVEGAEVGYVLVSVKWHA